MDFKRSPRTPTATIITVAPTTYYHLPLGSGLTLELSGKQLIEIAEIFNTFAQTPEEDAERIMRLLEVVAKEL